MGCAATTEFSDSDTDNQSFNEDWEEFSKFNAANEARIGTTASPPMARYDEYRVTTTKSYSDSPKKNTNNYEEYRKTTTTTMHVEEDVLFEEKLGGFEPDDQDNPNHQGFELDEDDLEPNYTGYERNGIDYEREPNHREHGLVNHKEYGLNHTEHGLVNHKEYGLKHREHEPNHELKEPNHRKYQANQVQGTISVALVLKEDLSERSETASDAPLAPVYQKGAEIMCRFRPANENEDEDDQCVQYGDLDADLKRDTDWELVDDEERWDALTKDETVCEVHTPKGSAQGKTRDFEFDRLFPPMCKNKNMYNVLRKQWFPSLVGGMSVGIIPYGVTGSGKSYTVHGTRQDPGMVPLFCQEVFRRLETDYGGTDFHTQIRVTFLEIYENKIVDLLQHREVTRRCKATTPLDPGRGLRVSHNKEQPFSSSPVPTATDREVYNTEELLEAFWMGYDRLRRMRVFDRGLWRKISLSNSVFILTIIRTHKSSGMRTNAQFQAVDLGGPFKPHELKVKKSDSKKLKPLQAAASRTLNNLNKSLVSFRKVMLWSDTKSTGRHKPYRDSKVTQILEPLLEKGKTAIIIHVSGCSEHARNTIETLRFGLKASQLFKEEINQDVQAVTRIEVEEEEPLYFTGAGNAVPRGVPVR